MSCITVEVAPHFIYLSLFQSRYLSVFSSCSMFCFLLTTMIITFQKHILLSKSLCVITPFIIRTTLRYFSFALCNLSFFFSRLPIVKVIPNKSVFPFGFFIQLYFIKMYIFQFLLRPLHVCLYVSTLIITFGDYYSMSLITYFITNMNDHYQQTSKQHIAYFTVLCYNSTTIYLQLLLFVLVLFKKEKYMVAIISIIRNRNKYEAKFSNLYLIVLLIIKNG